MDGEIVGGAVRGWLEGPPGHWVVELGTLASDYGFDGLLLWSEQIAGCAGEVAPAAGTSESRGRAAGPAQLRLGKEL